jgi:hypothetical protein
MRHVSCHIRHEAGAEDEVFYTAVDDWACFGIDEAADAEDGGRGVGFAKIMGDFGIS